MIKDTLDKPYSKSFKASTSDDLNCGLFSFRPLCLQRFANIQVFVFFSCVLVTIQQALSSGYFNSVITTIEKRFDISSRLSGTIASTFEIGNLLTVIFVSYFGANGHIPVWIGKGILVTGLGSLLFALPHFMENQIPFENNNISSSFDNNNICNIPSPSVSLPIADKISQFMIPSMTHFGNTLDCQKEGSYRFSHILIFIVAMVLVGSGGTPIFTLGTIYIDDHVEKDSCSMYIGCMYSMVAFGLVIGFLFGGYFITVHENAYDTGIIPFDIYHGHPKWIGAWWAGFILLGLLLILISIPFFAFPKSLKKPELEVTVSESTVDNLISIESSDTIANSYKSENSKIFDSFEKDLEFELKSSQDFINKLNQSQGKTLKKIPASIWKLLTNPIYMVTCLGSCMEVSIVSGFLVFLPKYLETQFIIDKSKANIFAGGIVVPGACIGIFSGGYILKKFQVKPKGAIQFVLFFNLICLGLYTALYFFGCNNIKMAGATLPYFKSTYSNNFKVNLTDPCNMECQCSSNDIEPVCGKNGITYFSSCHAGCKIAGGPRHTQTYSNCSCIIEDASSEVQGASIFSIATSGPCSQTCNTMIPFLFVLFIITLSVSITQMPLLMITLRSVTEDERAFALGMQFVLFRVFGYIPSPIIFGNVIDSTCLLWNAYCGVQSGSCLIYNIENFRLRYVGVCSGLKIAAGLIFFLDWLLIRWYDKKDSKSIPNLGIQELVSSIASLDHILRPKKISETDDLEPLKEIGLDSDYNSANLEDALESDQVCPNNYYNS